MTRRILGDRLDGLIRAIPGGSALAQAVLRLIDPERRALHALRERRDLHLFQPFPETFEDRYPELFDALVLRLARLEAPRILSFGCSRGMEVRALRQRLPLAEITGIDVNAWALDRARQADPDPRSRYILADAPDPSERYDAVLAMAVFRHGQIELERPEDCAAILPFADVAAGIARLDAVLRPGGWLAIYNAHFRFADMPVAGHYRAEPFRMTDHAPQTLLYGPDNRRIDGTEYDAVLFRKAPG